MQPIYIFCLPNRQCVANEFLLLQFHTLYAHLRLILPHKFKSNRNCRKCNKSSHKGKLEEAQKQVVTADMTVHDAAKPYEN